MLDNATTDYGATLHVTDLADDGVDDLIVGAPLFSSGQLEEGALHVIFGGATGISSTSLQEVIEPNVIGANLGAIIESGQFGADTRRDIVSTVNAGVLNQPVIYEDTGTGFGGGGTLLDAGGSVIQTLATGDANGDGVDDILGANFGEGGLQPTGVVTLITQDPGAPGTFSSPFNFSGAVGESLGLDTGIADLDGDSTPELLLTTPNPLNAEPPSVHSFELCL